MITTRNDNTRATRASRRESLLNAAAARMGAGTWQKLGTEIRRAVEAGGTDAQVADNLRAALLALLSEIKDGQANALPVDIVNARALYPAKKSGRPSRARPPLRVERPEL